MDRATIDDELSQPGAAALLASTQLAHVAYLGADGTPRVIPIGYAWTGEQIVLSTAATAPKVAALRERPRVAVTIDGGGTPDQTRSLSIRGTATVRIVDGLTEEYVAGARRMLDPEAAAEFERNSRAMYRQMARIAITPTWARYYDFGAGRLPRFLQELAEQAQAGG